MLTEWTLETVPAVAVLLAAGLYLYGVHRLRAAGHRWSRWRTISFVGLGLGSVALATQSALAAYDTVLLSVHMVQHMVLSMVAPVFLALGAPVTLALRTLPAGPHRGLLAVLHSKVAAVLTFPVVATGLFVLNPWILYFTPWYPATLSSAFLHDTMHLHFLLVGCLFFWPLIGLDPVPGRVGYPFRLIVVFLTLPFHAFLGITLMSSEVLIAGDWYASLGRDWGPSVARDQYVAGGVLWSSGDVIGLLFIMVLFVQWARASEREARREDRRLDRLERLERAGQRTDGRPAGSIPGDQSAAPEDSRR